MIPEYPNFTGIGLGVKDEIGKIFSKFEPYHDFSFVNLLCWNANDTTEVSFLNGNLVVRLPDYVNGEPVVTLLGNDLIDDSLEKLLTTTNRLRLVPEVVVDSIVNKENFNISEDRDNFDYIYKLADLSNLSGLKFKKKRNKTNAIREVFSEKIDIENSNYIDASDTDRLSALFSKWAINSRQTKEELQFEKLAFKKLLENSSAFNLLLTTVSIESSLVAFSINEIVSPEWAICHFEKSLSIHNQMGTFIAWQAAKDLLDIGCLYVNWEPDLGIDGLRKSKLSFQPDYFLKKYEIKRSSL